MANWVVKRSKHPFFNGVNLFTNKYGGLIVNFTRSPYICIGMKLFIKNMVCNRCIAVVSNEFDRMGYALTSLSMGEANTVRQLTREEVQKINDALHQHGFELIDDKKSTLIEKIKNIVIDQVHHSRGRLKVNYSTLISEQLTKDYSYLSNLFSEIEGITIEHFIILQKIEKVKELLVYDELNLSEIADELGYSSVAHLSNQFKKVTGLTPSYFKKIKENKRLSLDQLYP